MADDIVVNMNFNLGKDQTVADIVTRLRDRYPDVVHPHVLRDAELVNQAAKEIERLRAAGDTLVSVFTLCVCGFDGKPCRFCAARTTWREVRGD